MKKQNLTQLNKQQGFIFLIGLLVLVLGAGVWFGTVANLQSNGMQIEKKNEHIRELQRIKERMLTYAVMQPEIFRTNSGSTAVRAQEDIPGPGYFPCPDVNGDGDSDAPCGGTGVMFVTGLVPQSVSSRFFTFMDKPQEANRYWYAVDSRFLTQNLDYFYGGVSKRFVPLNRASPPLASLTLDGRNDIVMVLIFAGDEVQGQNQSVLSANNFLDLENGDGDADFISTFNDKERYNDHVIAITRTEWNAAVLSRVSKDVMSGITVGTVGDNVPDLCDTISVNDAHWFNGCSYTGGAPSFVDVLDPAKKEGVPLDVPLTNTSPLLNVTCWRNDVSIDENMYGQGWRRDLNCP